MGGSTSACVPSNIPNVKARMFFNDLKSIETDIIPDSIRKTKRHRCLIRVVYESMKRIPEQESEISLLISGVGVGPLFVEYYIPRLGFPLSLTKFSLRKSGLQELHTHQIAELLSSVKSLKHFDVGDNGLGESSSVVLSAAVNHPSLTVLQLESTDITDSSCDALRTILETSRKLETLRVGPSKMSRKAQRALKSSVASNLYLKDISISEALDAECQRVAKRNTLISELVDSISRAPFQQQFRTKIESFKSVKGREMLLGKAQQKERVRGTSLFDFIEKADDRAKNTEIQETAERSEWFRSGLAEMTGRRQTMEDVSIVLQATPTPSSILFGLFDGHGGREAAEFASSNLPRVISERLRQSDSLESAIISSFHEVQAEMKPWCLFVGTTSVIAIANGTRLTVANVGDSRCVLCRDGKAVRLTVDHKPDLPEESAYIRSKGGFVREGRISGMLAVSRALGDGFLGDAVNATPHIRSLDLTEDDSFMILACDGVWDVITDQQACDIVASEIDPLIAAKKLRDAAFERRSFDNISVIVVFLAEFFSK